MREFLALCPKHLALAAWFTPLLTDGPRDFLHGTPEKRCFMGFKLYEILQQRQEAEPPPFAEPFVGSSCPELLSFAIHPNGPGAYYSLQSLGLLEASCCWGEWHLLQLLSVLRMVGCSEAGFLKRGHEGTAGPQELPIL